jgi:Zn-dependent peptidase ImmA (M78 family)
MPVALLEATLADAGQIDLEDEQSLQPIAGMFGVSTQALSFRLAYLGVVPT